MHAPRPPGRYLIGADSTHRDHDGRLRQHGAQRFKHRRTQYLRGKELDRVRTGLQQCEGFCWVEETRDGKEPGLLRGAHDRRVGMRSDDETATRRRHFANLGWIGQGTGSNQHPAAEAARQNCDTLERAGRVERYLDDADTGPLQRRAERLSLGRLDTPQDGDQGTLFEPCSYVHCSLLPIAASPSAAASSSSTWAVPPQASIARA